MTAGSKIFWIVFLIFFILINTAAAFIKARHIGTIRAAKKVYRNINKIENSRPGWLISYLRKIDPFVFEELILLAFKKNRFRIKRNRCYTHDGGIDGQVRKNGQKYLVQAKRYSDYIKKEHVQQFIKTCRHHKACGYFIHTGKTGEDTKKLLKENPQIKLISREKLYDFFIAKKNQSNNLFF